MVNIEAFYFGGICLYNRLIITSGISVISNHRDLLGEQFPSLNLTGSTTEDLDGIVDQAIYFLIEEIMGLEEKELVRASAEIAIVAALKEQKRLEGKPYIVLFYTDTKKGYISACVNKYILEKIYEARVSLRKIYDFDVHNRSVLNRSLGKFLSDLHMSLLEGEPTTTCFAPIGGYKIMTSLGYLVGALHGFTTVYLYEFTNVLHEIPAIKIEIDDTFIEENHRTLKKFLDENCLEYEKLSEEELRLIKEQAFIFERVDDLVELNPLGVYLCEQDKFYKLFKSKVKMNASLYKFINRQYGGYRKAVYKEIRDLIYQFETNPVEYRGTLNHETTFSGVKQQSLEYHLFKGGNDPVFRALWKYSEEKDSYFIEHVWFDHDDYEREAKQRMLSVKKDTDWLDITEEVYT